MKTSLIKLALSVLVVSGLTFQAQAATVTSITVVDSSSSSWVARGLQNYTITPEMGWTFDVDSNFDNGVSFFISNFELSGGEIDLWFLDFAAPFNEQLAVGLYEDFQRFPFQDPDRPGLAFGSTGRLDNMASGFFNILEISYDDFGIVTSFSADFTHFGEQNPNNWAIVELRYNATVVPVPAAIWLLFSGLIGLGVFRKLPA